jgi:hypothetical protein
VFSSVSVVPCKKSKFNSHDSEEVFASTGLCVPSALSQPVLVKIESEVVVTDKVVGYSQPPPIQ